MILLTKLKTFKNFLQSKLLFLLGLHAKIHMKLVYFFSNNILAYLFYICFIVYGHFSSLDINYSHIFPYIFVYYLLFHSFEFYVLCNLKITRKWLEDSIGETVLISYLGDKKGGKPFILFLIGYMVIIGLELTTSYIQLLNNHVAINDLISSYEVLFGHIPYNWEDFQKRECEEAIYQLRLKAENSGIIRKLMFRLHI